VLPNGEVYIFSDAVLLLNDVHKMYRFMDQELTRYRYSSCCCCCCCCCCSCWGDALRKSRKLRSFKSDRGEIWRVRSSSKYASNDGVGVLIWRHTFKMAAMHAAASAGCPLARGTRVTSLASFMHYSSRSILPAAITYNVFFAPIFKHHFNSYSILW